MLSASPTGTSRTVPMMSPTFRQPNADSNPTDMVLRISRRVGHSEGVDRVPDNPLVA